MARERGSLLKTVAFLPLAPLAYPLGLLYGWWQRRETIVGMLRLGGRALVARSPDKRAWLSTALAGGGVVVLWYGVPWVWSHLPTLPSSGPPLGSSGFESMPGNGVGFVGEDAMLSLMRKMTTIILPLMGVASLGAVTSCVVFGLRIPPMLISFTLVAGTLPVLLWMLLGF